MTRAKKTRRYFLHIRTSQFSMTYIEENIYKYKSNYGGFSRLLPFPRNLLNMFVNKSIICIRVVMSSAASRKLSYNHK